MLQLQSIKLHHRGKGPFFELLREIAREEHRKNRGILTVLVVKKAEKKPGIGFYEIAEELGKDITDKEKLRKEETNFVCDYWKSN